MEMSELRKKIGKAVPVIIEKYGNNSQKLKLMVPRHYTAAHLVDILRTRMQLLPHHPLFLFLKAANHRPVHMSKRLTHLYSKHRDEKGCLRLIQAEQSTFGFRGNIRAIRYRQKWLDSQTTIPVFNEFMNMDYNDYSYIFTPTLLGSFFDPPSWAESHEDSLSLDPNFVFSTMMMDPMLGIGDEDFELWGGAMSTGQLSASQPLFDYSDEFFEEGEEEDDDESEWFVGEILTQDQISDMENHDEILDVINYDPLAEFSNHQSLMAEFMEEY
ncbi:uncharacterized protein CEXT_686211 [Caerostris extrusa]|uniref:Uncharacterized protein n=1 Tax=Caerostris extrusa TaxID=172846 RepID=A0AAV4U4I6_CAEEX|nr:uncharacterized protein CEXT_686211 [Caerostris extrusa]